MAKPPHKVSASHSVTALWSFLIYGLVSAMAKTDKMFQSGSYLHQVLQYYFPIQIYLYQNYRIKL